MSVLDPYIAYIKVAICIALLCVAFFFGHHLGAQAGAVKLAKATAAAAQDAAHVADLATKASEAARVAEHTQAQAFATISQQYEQDEADAQIRYEHTLAGLRSGTLRLRSTWNCPRTVAGVPEAGAGAGKPDAATSDRDESAARVVRAAAEADAQIRALQAILTAERQP